MNKKVLIFDMGGVLVDLDVEKCKAAFKQILGYHEIDRIIDACHQKGIYGELEEGILSVDAFRSIVLAGSRHGTSEDDVDYAMRQLLVGISPYKAELLLKLSESYDLYLLSNNNPICMPESARMFAEAGIPLDKIFKKCFLSYEMKLMKPSEEFYRVVMDEIGVPSDRLLFIDDSRKNVDAAISSGLPAVCYEPGSDLSVLLAEVLDDPSLIKEDR